jgi:hypothetical protein
MDEYPVGRRGYAAIGSWAGTEETRVAARNRPSTKGRNVFLKSED